MRFGIGIFVIMTALAGPLVAETALNITVPEAGDDIADTVRNASLVRQALAEGTTDPQELLASAQADYGRLLGVLYANARYGGVISIRVNGREAADISPLSPPSAITSIDIDVTPGPAYLFSEATAAPLAQGTEMPGGFAVGSPGTTTVITEAATAAVTGWRETGYAKAEVINQRIVAQHDDARIATTLDIAPGPLLTFGPATVTGNDAVRTRRILTIAGAPEGEVFDPDEVERIARRLRRTGSFRSVTIQEAENVGPNSTLPLTIGVVEQTPRRFGFGAEYSTVDGVRLSAFWLHRNLLGGAERFRVEGEVAGIGGETGGTDYSVGVRYERPATPRADTDLYALAEIERLDEPDFLSTTGEFALGFTRYATDDLTVDFGLGYLFSEVEDDFGTERFSLVTLPLGATLDRRDNALNPKKGYFVDLDVTPFYALSGTDNGGQVKLDARAYRTVGEALTFAGRMQLGALFGPDLLDSPTIYRFYSGGGGTVRGQDYQSLGIDVSATQRTGGRSFLGLSAEARRSVTESIEVVGFVDWGYIGSEAFPDLTGDSHAGAGLGVRYNTGIGPIRLDLATPVAGDTEASNIYFYIGIGQAF